MTRFLPSTLQRRFLVGLLCIVLVTAGFFFAMLNNHIKEIYLSEAHSKADLMVAHTEAIQYYVRSVLRPAVSGRIGMDEFIIEAMSSSYVTRNILGELNMKDKDFIYRRVARNARNPESEVNAMEALFFDKFLTEPKATRMEDMHAFNGKNYLVVARPVYFDESCMRCHGDPIYAPAVLLDMYGSERGFWRKQDELAGLDIVSVPLETSASGINKSVTVFSACFGAGMLLLLLSVQGFFNRLVVHNLRRVGHILHQNFFQEGSNEVLASLRKEVNIETMIHSINKVAEHLKEARAKLSDYAKNLEKMVKERTSALEQAVHERSADVQLFMRLLSDLNNTQEKAALVQTSLRLITGHFSASRAAYMCGLSGASYTEWPVPQNPNYPGKKQYTGQLQRQLRLGEPAMYNDVWLIPVQTSGQTRGMLGLYWGAAQSATGKEDGMPEADPRNMPKPADFPLALALGRQLGIALDNLDAIDAILRQNSLLDSIVEGVSDPLILVEADMRPILSNSSARRLARTLLKNCDLAPQEAVYYSTEVAALLRHLGLDKLEPQQEQHINREITLPEGRSFAVSVHPISPSSSGDLRSVVHLHETTEEKRILSHMRQSDKLAAVGQLAAGLAHEINNPLGVIHCYAELMGSTDLDEQRHADLEVILRHVEQARSVLNDMLDFSSTRASCPGPCDINALLTSTYDIFKSQGRTKSFEINLNLEAGIPTTYVDKRMLEQVIINLLLNAKDAVKACRPATGGVITLSSKHDAAANTVIISVVDNGPGIPEQFLPQIFDPFFTTKNPGEGTGLGLTIAFGMVNDMGGTIEAHSPANQTEYNKGTVFNITIPVGPSEACL